MDAGLAYAGNYGEGGRVTITIRRAGWAHRSLSGARRSAQALTPVSDSHFFDKVGDEYAFHRAADGPVTYPRQWPGGREIRRKRMP